MISAREADQPAQMMMSHQGKKWDSYVCRKRKEPASALFDMDDRENNMFDISANRRELLIAPLLATMPTAFLSDHANASPIDPAIWVSRHRTEALRPTSRGAGFPAKSDRDEMLRQFSREISKCVKRQIATGV